VWETHLVTPVSSSDRDNVELGISLCTLDGVGNFLGALGAEAKVAVGIAEGDKGLESKTVTGLGLLLDRVDLEAFFTKSTLGVTVWGAKEVVDNLLLLDWEGVEVDVFEALDLASLDKTSELGAWGPDFLVVPATSAATSTTAATATSAATVATAASATISKATAEAASITSFR
jgi:hypothetical protein